MHVLVKQALMSCRLLSVGTIIFGVFATSPPSAQAHEAVFDMLQKRGTVAQIATWLENLLAPPANALASPANTKESDFKGPTKPKGISAKNLDKFDLGKELPGMKGHNVRARYWTVKPGGVVPVHSHKDRPAMIYVLTGKIIEHRSSDEHPHVYKKGDLSVEAKSVLHWWENRGDETVHLLAIDVFDTKK